MEKLIIIITRTRSQGMYVAPLSITFPHFFALSLSSLSPPPFSPSSLSLSLLSPSLPSLSLSPSPLFLFHIHTDRHTPTAYNVLERVNEKKPPSHCRALTMKHFVYTNTNSTSCTNTNNMNTVSTLTLRYKASIEQADSASNVSVPCRRTGTCVKCNNYIFLYR